MQLIIIKPIIEIIKDKTKEDDKQNPDINATFLIKDFLLLPIVLINKK